MTGERMSLSFQREGDVLFVGVAGRVDGATAREFEEGVRGAMAETDRGLVMDFRELAYISSAGLRVILLTAKLLASRNGQMLCCNLSDTIHRLFEVSGFAKIIPIHPSREAARAVLRAELTGK